MSDNMAGVQTSFVVHGTVTDGKGTPLALVEIEVLWQHIRQQTAIGKGVTAADGTYSIRYGLPAGLSERLLIVVRASSDRIGTSLSSPLTQAEPDLKIDLHVQAPDSSEWARHWQAIHGLLESLKIEDVVENADHQDISFLSLELSQDTETIMRAVISARLEAAFTIPAPVFYAFLAQRIPTALPNPLLESSQNFTLIDSLLTRIGSLIFGLAGSVQQSTLTSAVALNLIGPQYAVQIPSIVAQLQTLRTTDILSQPYLAGKSTLSQILNVVKLPADRQQAFAKALISNTASMRHFWRTLGDGKHGFTAQEASDIERTLSVGAFVKNHLPLLELLLQTFADGTHNALPDLARLTEQQWVAFVNQVGAPPSIDPAGTATAAEVFARVVYARVTRAYPTAALSSRIASGKDFPDPQRAPLTRFFQNNPTLDLLKLNIPVYLAAQGEAALAGIDAADRPAVIDNARRMQRVLRVVPSVDAAATLLSLGIHSATQIATMGQQQFFIQATKAGITKSEANRIYRAGAARYAQTVSRFMKYNRDAIGIWPSAMGQTSDLNRPIQAAIQQDPSLATLFGSLDFCEIDSCTSMLSPAAYLCDLLLWLQNHPQGSRTALDVLDARRPDIRHLLLNCPNTETEFPYIDLVNELLADAVNTPTDPNSTVNPIWKQTSADQTADRLRAAPQYFNQTAYSTLFDASYPHTLPYSAGLDELRTYLQRLSVPLWQIRQALLPVHNAGSADRAAVAAERLGISPHEQDLICNANFVAADVAWNIADPGTAIAFVPAFLQAASVTYESMLELLRSSWVQGGLNVSIQGINESCDTSVQTLSPTPLDPAFLDRAHRFLRLWRRTGYKMWELDLLLTSTPVTGGSLTADALNGLQKFWQLQQATGLAVDAQLAWYQAIDTASHRDPDGTSTASLYGRMFLNSSATTAGTDPDLAALVSGGTVQKPNLSDHLPAVQAALGISAADAAILFGLTGDELTLDNLSLVYRVSSLARSSKLALADLLAIARLVAPSAVNPAAALTPIFGTLDATLDFLAQAKVVQQSGFTIDALVYLLTPAPWSTTTQMTETDITRALTAVRQAMFNPSGGDMNGSVIAAVAANAHRAANPALANDVAALILNLPLQQVGQTLLTLLTDPSLATQTTIDTANFPNAFLAVQLFDKVALVVRRLRLVRADLAWLLSSAASYGGLDFAELPLTNGQAPVNVSSLLAILLVVKLARLFTAAPPQSQVQTLYDVIGGVTAGTLVNEAAAQAALVTITGWPLTDVVSFTSKLGAVFPPDYVSPWFYDSLRTLEAMAAATHGTGPQLAAWGAVPQTEQAAEVVAASALGVLKALHTDSSEWLTFAPTLTDPIRERRSAALQGYLLAQRDSTGTLLYRDVNALFDRFLIDVQMSSCQVTTRVVQAYIAVQIFVERCLMNLEAPAVVADVNLDDTWNQWEWMKRYRIWQAGREVFLYPENWLIETQRENRTEIYRQLEQEVHQNQSTSDYLETVVLNYLDRLDGIAHLHITGTCQDPMTGTLYTVGRTVADPAAFYVRTLEDGAWSGWTKIPLDIRAHQVVPAIYRGRVCLFWTQVKVSNEPHQEIPPAVQDSVPSQEVDKYVTLDIHFSIFRNGAWSAAQAARGSLFDKPPLSSDSVSNATTVESIYTLKVQTAAPTPGYGASLYVDVFRYGYYQVSVGNTTEFIGPYEGAIHLGRAVFDGRFTDLTLRNLQVPGQPPQGVMLLQHAQAVYGPDAQPLLPLPANLAEPQLLGEPNLIPRAGALTTRAADATGSNLQNLPLTFTSAGAMQLNVGPLLDAAPVPFRVVGPVTDLAFEPSSYFYFQDNRRSFYVESKKLYWAGSAWSPVPPSNSGTAPFQVQYMFHRFYHPFTRLFWHQLFSGGFPLLYDRNLQLNPDQVDLSGTDAFSFQVTYKPEARVTWGHNEQNRDREFLDFTPSAAYSVYNWELFFHIPLYVAEQLSHNQQFEDAQKWFHYIFDPTRAGSDPAPKRFWIPKPLYNLTSAEILAQQIGKVLQGIDVGDADDVHQVESWRGDPFNPYRVADLRPVAYMKRTIMSYLDNLIAWADNLFATESREALSEATLLYVIASEILGPPPVATTPPQHTDESFDQLQPKLDAFANAMVDIENTIGGQGGGGGNNGGGIPGASTFYFAIPPNDTLLGYWITVADRLFKLRHCQNIQGQSLQLALFDAPIDPGLLIKAQSAGIDLTSVLSDLTVTLPNYRFTFLYGQALDFVNAVRAYGALLLSALEKSDAAQLGTIAATNQIQLLKAGDQIAQFDVDQAQNAIDALNKNLELGQKRLDYYSTQKLDTPNVGEAYGLTASGLALTLYSSLATVYSTVGEAYMAPFITFGASGFGGTPQANTGEGGKIFGDAFMAGASATKSVADALDKAATLSNTIGKYAHTLDDWDEKYKEQVTDIDHTNLQIAGAQIALQSKMQALANHQTQIDELQQQLDFLTGKFTNQDLYDWMAGKLADTYFQSFRLACRLCKQVEKCYQFELGIQDSSFIQFGYWDSLHKGLLAGESLNQDLRRMQSSYLDENKRRFELSRFVSLGTIDPTALKQLLTAGACDFDLTESLFDNDYPGHYNRHLLRVSVTVVYPNPGKFDNVKATLTLVSNKVRVSTDLGSGYAETPVGSDLRFLYNYAAVPQKIAMGNALDDPGLFLTAINNNLSDSRYLPFENAGAVSSWHLEMPEANNEIDITTVGDAVLHVFYTALDGGDAFQQAVVADNLANAPTSGVKLFSAQNDFATAWAAFLITPAANTEQALTLAISPSRFPPWTRGKTITVSSMDVLAVSSNPGTFVLQPQSPLPAADINMTPLPNITQPNILVGTVVPSTSTTLGTWTLKLRRDTAAHFDSLTKSDIGDVFLLVNFQVS